MYYILINLFDTQRSLIFLRGELKRSTRFQINYNVKCLSKGCTIHVHSRTNYTKFLHISSGLNSFNFVKVLKQR